MSFENFREAEREGWNARAGLYDRHTALATEQIVPAMLDALRLKPGMRMLDVACGTGNVAAAATARGCRVEGIDFAPAMVLEARNRHPDIAFAEADAERLPHRSGSFDAVACNIGLFHVADPGTAMREAARVLRPGGRYAFSHWAAPAQSELYGRLISVVSRLADLSLADAAPDAYLLSDPSIAEPMLATAGFEQIETQMLPTKLIANGSDFFEFFLNFGVRVPLIVAAQEPAIQERLRAEINATMQPYETETGFEVPMPSLLYSGEKP